MEGPNRWGASPFPHCPTPSTGLASTYLLYSSTRIGKLLFAERAWHPRNFLGISLYGVSLRSLSVVRV